MSMLCCISTKEPSVCLPVCPQLYHRKKKKTIIFSHNILNTQNQCSSCKSPEKLLVFFFVILQWFCSDQLKYTYQEIPACLKVGMKSSHWSYELPLPFIVTFFAELTVHVKWHCIDILYVKLCTNWIESLHNADKISFTSTSSGPWSHDLSVHMEKGFLNWHCKKKKRTKKKKKSPKPSVELSASACQPILIKNPTEVKDQACETQTQHKANISCLCQ